MNLDELLDRMEGLLAAVEELPEDDRETVFSLLDAVDQLHRVALGQVGRALADDELERLRDVHPAVAWLWEAYGVGLNDRAAAERAMEDIRPYIHSHGGEVHIRDVVEGIVHVELSGSCSGCSASAITLQEGVEHALRAHVPGYEGMEVIEDENATPHAPPGPTLLQIQPHPDSTLAQNT